MLAFLKFVIGVGGIGAGVAVPVVVNKITSGTGAVVKTINESHLVKAIRQEVTEKKENEKVIEAFKDLQQKDCQLVNNPKNQNDSFEALYACREGGDKKSSVAHFYYLGKREDVKKNGVSEVKKVKSLSYKEESNSYKISLTLENAGGSHSTNVVELAVEDQNKGGWANFSNVNLSSSCRIVKPLLGRDVLECNLSQDGGKTSLYSFGVL